MSADKLAAVIGGAEPGHRPSLADPDRAADRVREAFVVIDRNDLPEVEPERPGYSEYVYIGGQTHALMSSVGQYDDMIRELVAIREYRREHPYIDEEAVKELGHTLDGAFCDAGLSADPELTTSVRDAIARRVIANGWTKSGAGR